MPYFFIALFFSFLFTNALVAQPANTSTTLPDRQNLRQQWIDSTYTSLNKKQRIGQLFMVAAYSGGEKFNQPLIEKLITEQGIGGLIFMQGSPAAQIDQTNSYQQRSQVPLLIGMDAEWGLGMRLTGVKDFPRQLMMGAMQDSTLVYKIGSAIAGQCRRMGVHINFAPVVDVNNNPNNPVINFRSFGENKEKVANFSIQYMHGLQDNGIIACAKHFPGHGDTDVDSHKDLPEIRKSLAQLDSLELYPFQRLIDNGVQSIMIAHLRVPAIDARPNTPTTLSDKAVRDLLKTKMGFTGLVFTDALNMQGVAKFYQPGEIDLKAFMAGNDVLLFSQDVPAGIAAIEQALTDGRIQESQLEESVKKILAAKYEAGLHTIEPKSSLRINDELNTLVTSLRKQVAEAAITLLSDPYQIIDHIKRTNGSNITYVGVGNNIENAFTKALQQSGIGSIKFAPTDNARAIKKFMRKLDDHDMLIIGVHNMSGYPTQQYGLDESELELISKLSKQHKSMLVVFGNPYALKNFCQYDGVLMAYDETEETQVTAAEILTGQLKAKGKLPVTVCPRFKYGDGILSLTGNLGEVIDSSRFERQVRQTDNASVVPKQTIQFPHDFPLECCVSPNALGINNTELDKIDQFIEQAIGLGAFPGCRILVAKAGKVFYDKPFGSLHENKNLKVDINTVYDLASITKVASTTLAIMKLYDEGKINLNGVLGDYLNSVKGTDKEFLKINDILLHQAGLKSWIPFYKETLDSAKQPLTSIYNKVPSAAYNVQVAPGLYMQRNWLDTMWQRILKSPLENRGHYVYSDLDFIILQKVVEEISKVTLYEFVQKEFYAPLGLTHTAYNPKRNLSGKDIAPTESDNYFRYQIIQGFVHDMGAAMMGGVAGHAGLFSSANDLAVIFQMLLNGGVYRGKRYLKKATVDLFTARGSGISRRGLGFDKPEIVAGKSSPCAANASASTFGHQGFTGTCVWADPQHELLFVFLSNRTYPSAENSMIRKLGVREKVQEYVYNAMGIAPRYRK